MKRIVSCFECGFRYDSKRDNKCLRCGEIKVFNRRIHDENYDFAKDSFETSKILIIATFILFGILSLIVMNGWQSFVL